MSKGEELSLSCDVTKHFDYFLSWRKRSLVNRNGLGIVGFI